MFSTGVRRMIAAPDLEARICEMGLEPVGDAPAAFARKLDSEMQHRVRAIQETGIKLD